MLNNLDDLMGCQKADILYTDPPWGEGMLKYFRTHNGQINHADNWMEFVRRLKFIKDRHVSGSAFIEIGNRNEADIREIFGYPQGRYIAKYKNGTSLVLGYGEQPLGNPNGKTGVSLVTEIISTLPSRPKSVLDCCVGLGMTVKAAKKLGMKVYANELNLKRATATMKIMQFAMVGSD